MENKDILEYVRPYIEDELDLYFKENPVKLFMRGIKS